MNITPEQQRNIDKERKSFNENWYLDLETVEIRRKKSPWWKIPIDIIWPVKNSVFSMYWYIKHERLTNEKARCFDFPLKHDGMPIKGQPTKYKLNEEWSIPRRDLKYLSGGPLIDKNMKLLVPPDFNFRNFLLNVIPVFKVITAIVVMTGALIKWWPQLETLFL